MQFKLNSSGSLPPVDEIARAIDAVDPASIVDLDPAGDALRISTSVGGDELGSIILQAGYALSPGQLEQLPSQCCGGCGG